MTGNKDRVMELAEKCSYTKLVSMLGTACDKDDIGLVNDLLDAIQLSNAAEPAIQGVQN